jgi:hypothetical protein
MKSSGKKNKGKWKHEWHLYSAFCIVGSLTFIVINISSGTAQVLGIAFSGLIGTFLFTSKSWKNLSQMIHCWSIGITILAVLIFIPLIYLKNKNYIKNIV